MAGIAGLMPPQKLLHPKGAQKANHRNEPHKISFAKPHQAFGSTNVTSHYKSGPCSIPKYFFEDVGRAGCGIRADVGLFLSDLVEQGFNGLAYNIRRQVRI